MPLNDSAFEKDEKWEQANWIERCIAIEVKRRAEAKSFKERAQSLADQLNRQIHGDFEKYHSAFPGEFDHIRREESNVTTGLSRFVRTTPSGGGKFSSDRQPPEVTFGFEYQPDIALHCRFGHRPELDRRFHVVLAEQGNSEFEGRSVVEVSEYLLRPVLFEKFREE